MAKNKTKDLRRLEKVIDDLTDICEICQEACPSTYELIVLKLNKLREILGLEGEAV